MLGCILTLVNDEMRLFALRLWLCSAYWRVVDTFHGDSGKLAANLLQSVRGSCPAFI
jgi:hypothetical protein